MPRMLRRHWAAVVLFFVLTLILTNPLVLHIWNAVEDKQDALLNTWILAWVGHALTGDPLNLFQANIFFPYRNTLAFSEILVPQALLAAPITLATNNPIFGYNLVLLGMLWLDAFAMYLLVLEWTGSRPAGWLAGAIYAFNPFNLSNLAQFQLLSLGWLPLALLYLSRLLISLSQSRHRLAREVILFSLFFALQALSSIYYALLGGVAVLLYVICWAWTERRQLTRIWRESLLSLVAAALLAGAFVAPFLVPYFSVQRELGLQRRVEESEPFSASLKQFVEVSPKNLVYGSWLAPQPETYVGGYPLDNLFPGLAALVLTGIGLVRASKREGRLFLVSLLIVSFVLALGPRLYITPGQTTDITLPYRWLFDVLWPLRALRAPVRFEALIMFALAALSGIGIASLLPPSPVDRTARSALLVLGAVALVGAEYLAVPAANMAAMPVADEIPAVYKWLAQQPPGVVLELPMMGQDPKNPRQADISTQYYSTYHWQKTPDGFSGFFAPRRGDLAYEIDSLPSARAVSLLQALDVDYLVLHRDRLAQDSPLRAGLDGAPGLERIGDWGDATVYRVAPRTGFPAEIKSQLYLPQPAQAGGAYRAFLILANPSSVPFAVRPTDKLELTARWSDGRTEDLAVPLPLVTSSASVVPISLTAPAKPGSYSVTIVNRNNLLDRMAMQGQVVVGSDGTRETVIPATVELQQPLAGQYDAGATVTVRVIWRALNKIGAYYSVSVRIVDSEGNKLSAIDREPRGKTFLWRPEEAVEDEFDLVLPPETRPGKYRVELLMYEVESGGEVLLLDQKFIPHASILLGEFEVR